MHAFSTLDLGDPKDARTWVKGCTAKSLREEHCILSMSPTTEQLTAFFRGEPDWVYFSGHYNRRELWGDKTLAQIDFDRDNVTLNVRGQQTVLKKGTGALALAESAKLVIWGGCNALAREPDVKVLRELFRNATLLGYSDFTGVAINNAMLGGGFIKRAFFQRITSSAPSSQEIVNAWMGTAKAGYTGNSLQLRFRAVGTDGQEWKLVDGKVVKGVKY